MKRILIALAAVVGVSLSAHANLVYSNSFGYDEGAIDTVSVGSPLGLWYWHSGSTNQLQVADGQVILGGSNSEDVSAYITNSAFPLPFATGPGNGSLYASFTINMSSLPTGSSGAYFFHFRDTGTMNFRARTWASTNGAAAGTYRVGISAAGNSAVFVPLDLPLNETHKLVVRWNLEQTNATVWVDPISESSAVNRADSTDTSTAFSAYNVCLREASASAGAGTLNFDDLLVGTAFADVSGSGGPPAIGGIANQSIPMNGNTGPVPVFIDSASTQPSNLVLSATSANTTLVPNNPANIAFGGSGQNRTITITPASGQQGTSLISVVVTDDASQSNTNSFTVTVGAPRFVTTIADQVTPINTATAVLPFTVWDNETPNTLTITATSSNPTLVQDTDIVISPPTGTNRTVKVTPQSNQAGLTVITLTVSDGFTSASTSFSLIVFPHLGLVLDDSFTYPDGEINAVSELWQAHSAAASNDCLIINNQLRVSSTNSEDVNRIWSNSWYFVASGGDVPPQGFAGVILYSKFTVNFAKLPSGSGGGYFAHFKDAGTSNFRARVFAETNGAAAGKFRLGIANGGFTVAAVSRDLSLGTTYTVVTRYNVSTAQSTIWVDPHSESSEGASATDATTPIEIDSYCFRQDSSSPTAGVVFVDDLLVGTAFTDVVNVAPPAPIALNIASSSGNAVLTWANPAFNLQSAPSLSGPWTTLWDAASGYSTPITPAQQYFRLFYYQ